MPRSQALYTVSTTDGRRQDAILEIILALKAQNEYEYEGVSWNRACKVKDIQKEKSCLRSEGLPGPQIWLFWGHTLRGEEKQSSSEM